MHSRMTARGMRMHFYIRGGVSHRDGSAQLLRRVLAFLVLAQSPCPVWCPDEMEVQFVRRGSPLPSAHNQLQHS